MARVILFCAITAISVLGPMLLTGDPLQANPAAAFQPPGGAYPLGTDQLGRDLWTRLVFGARVSLLNGFEALLVGLTIGVPIGLVAGYLGGYLDEVLMGGVEILMAVPGILLAILAVATLGPGHSHIALAVGLVSGPLFARVVRATALALREQEFVVAARALGASEARVLLRHIVPGSISPLAVMSVIRLGTAIVAVAGLGFLGLGGDPSVPEWGAMLGQGQEFLRQYRPAPAFDLQQARKPERRDGIFRERRRG
jgi:peptide/nickel transport system permease protein